MKRLVRWVLLLVLAGGMWVAFSYYHYILRPFSIHAPGPVTIHPGLSSKGIARVLETEGVIRSAFYCEWYFRLFMRGKTLKAGQYTFPKRQNTKQVIWRLLRGEVVLTSVTIKEGLTIPETARLLETKGLFPAQSFIAAAQKTELIREIDGQAEDLEGYLFPDTYRVHAGITASEFVRIMTDTFKKNFNTDLIWRCRDIQFSIRDAVTLASLIEKETSIREERFKISSVFHNRLRLKMRLDCDPTIVYALMRADRYDGKLGWDDLKYDSPYNTRIYGGLPPGPICNPGLASIEGALYPDNTRYLYFVAKDGREHYFSETLSEHNRAVRQFVIQRNAFRR